LEHAAPGRFTAEGEGKANEVHSSKYAFQRGDVLYGKLRPYLDKAVLAEWDGICSTELLVLRPKEGVDPRFLVGVVHAPIFIEHAVAGTTGVQHPRTSWNHIRDFELPAFDRAEQSKMADLLWQVQDSLKSNEAAIEAGLMLKRAAMTALFSRGLRGEAQTETEFGPAPESWSEVPLDDCAIVQTGATKGRRFAGAETVEVPYLRVANVQDGHLDLSEMKEIRIRKSEIDRYRLQRGDVVLTEGGDFDKLGRGFIWRGELDLCVHQNHVFAVRTVRERLLPEFFAYLAQSAYGKAYFLKVAHKTTNLASINSTKLKAFPVLVPPTLNEQSEIVAILDAIDRDIDLHKRKRALLDELFKSLLNKLITGEIRLTDPNLSVLNKAAAAA
jgi:type I restriction enzyme S subunit